MDEKINTSNQSQTEVFSGGKDLGEQSNAVPSVPKARPEQYINTVSATVIMLIRLLEGAAAGFSLYHVFKVMAPFFGEISKGALQVNQAIQLIAAEYGILLSSEIEKMLSDITIGGLTLSLFVWVGALLIILIGLLLIVVDAIALLGVRFAQKGAGVIKIIHQIYMWLNAGALVFLAFSLYDYYRYQQSIKDLSYTAYTSTSGLWVPVIIFYIICALIYILQLCFHKDIAIAMKTVEYETDTGNQGEFRRTHLSGICIFFSLPFMLSFIAIVIGIVIHLTSGASSTTGVENFTVQDALFMAMPVIMMFKYLCISSCYKNLAHARGGLDGYTNKAEKSGHFFRNLIIIIIVAAVLYLIISKGLYKGIMDNLNGSRNTISTVSQTEETGSERQTETKLTDKAEKMTASSTPSDNSNSNAGGVSPDFKEFMDSYEEFMNQYCDFMETFDESDTKALVEYTSLLAKYAEFASKVQEYDEKNLNDEDYKYYIDVMARVNKRLIDATGSIEQQ